MGSSRSGSYRNSGGSSSPATRDALLLNGNGGSANKAARCRHVLTCLLPVVGGLLVLLVLLELLTGLGIGIGDKTISDALAAYRPYGAVLVPAAAGASFMFAVTLMRSVQIRVHFNRSRTYSRSLSVLNWVAAASNILAYVGFVVLAFWRTDGDDREVAVHYAGATAYFVFLSLYAVLHGYLLGRQTQYPIPLKLVFAALAVAGVASSAIFGFAQVIECEWIAVVLASAYIMLFSVLFHIDPVEDELAAFCSCCCKRRQQR